MAYTDVNCTLHLFKLANLPTEENFKLDLVTGTTNLVDSLKAIYQTTYLKIENYQIQRIQMNNIFQVDLSQVYSLDINNRDNATDNNFNYCIIENHFNKNTTPVTYMLDYIAYKIDEIIWNGMKSCKIYAKLDVLNTLTNVSFTNNCLIERCHIDRFRGISGGYLLPQIDYREEPFDEPIKYLKTSTSLDSIRQDGFWNIIYYSDPNAKNAIRILIAPDTLKQNVTVRLNTSSHVSIANNKCLVIRGSENIGTTITYNSNTFQFGSSGYDYEEIHCFYNNSNYNVVINGYNLDPSGDWNLINNMTIASYQDASEADIYFDNNLNYYEYPSTVLPVLEGNLRIPMYPATKKYASLSATTGSRDIMGLDSFNLTNPRIVKVISCPVCPVDIATSPSLFVNVSDDYMSVDCIEYVSDDDFPTREILTSTGLLDLIAKPSSFNKQAPDVKYETKLLNSKFTEFSFEYNAYKLRVRPEMWSLWSLSNATLPYKLYYKQSKFKSDLLFKLGITLPNRLGGLPTEQFNYLVSDIDNEKPIYTSDYINYMKTGYNFDKASINRQTTVSSALAATSILGGVAGIAAGAATGGISAAAGISLITGGISSAINIINNKIAAEADIKRKITAFQNSSTGISGVNALDLRKEYKAFDLYIRKYQMNTDMQDYFYEFFKEFGYAQNIYDNPSYFMNTRRYYNYIKLGICQFNPPTVARYQKHKTLLKEYERIALEGFTVFHVYNDSGDKKYEFTRYYENFETSLDN